MRVGQTAGCVLTFKSENCTPHRAHPKAGSPVVPKLPIWKVVEAGAFFAIPSLLLSSDVKGVVPPNFKSVKSLL